MRRFPFSLLAIVLLLAYGARADILFYGGDFQPNAWYANELANENDAIVHGIPYGAAAYQNFIVPVGQTWNITGLFSNDVMTIAPTAAYWEIRGGISEGNGGTLLASGTGTDAVQLKNQYGEYTNTVSGLNILLGPGMYWFTVVPLAPDQNGRSYNTNTFGENGVGTTIRDQQYLNSPYFNATFTNADNINIFPMFSSGVIGNAPVPEPSSLIMLGTGLAAVAGGVRRKLSRKISD